MYGSANVPLTLGGGTSTTGSGTPQGGGNTPAGSPWTMTITSIINAKSNGADVSCDITNVVRPPALAVIFWKRTN